MARYTLNLNWFQSVVRGNLGRLHDRFSPRHTSFNRKLMNIFYETILSCEYYLMSGMLFFIHP